MNINVTVDGGIDLSTELGEEIRHYDDETGEYETRGKTLGDLVAEKLVASLIKSDEWPGLKQKVLDIREDEIRNAIRPTVEKALVSDVRKTNSYGEPTGPAKPMRELIVEQVSVVLRGKSDRYSTSAPLLDTVMDRTVRALLTKELKEAFDSEKAKVVAAVRAEGTRLIAEAVEKGIGR